MKKVIYYTQIFYLDAALEHIKLASQKHDLHVYIEIAPESTRANIFNLNVNLNNYKTIVAFEDVVADWKLFDLQPYFAKCKSVVFVVHNFKRSLSFSSLQRAYHLIGDMKKKNPDCIHFDDLSLRMIGLLPLVVEKKRMIVMNVHDPKPHSGERDYKKEVIKKIFFKIINQFVCFSEHSKSELSSIIPAGKRITVLYLLPYSYYRNFIPQNVDQEKSKVTFVGRISKYKGIELFLNALPIIKQSYPNQKFCIAGKLIPNYNPPFDDFLNVDLEVINEHLSNERLTEIIISSKVIICPYLDATQSGVIMTANALRRPVIVTPVGGLPEYVVEGRTGSVVKELTPESLAASILSFLKEYDEKYKSDNGDDIVLTELISANEHGIDVMYNSMES